MKDYSKMNMGELEAVTSSIKEELLLNKSVVKTWMYLYSGELKDAPLSVTYAIDNEVEEGEILDLPHPIVDDFTPTVDGHDSMFQELCSWYNNMVNEAKIVLDKIEYAVKELRKKQGLDDSVYISAPKVDQVHDEYIIHHKPGSSTGSSSSSSGSSDWGLGEVLIGGLVVGGLMGLGFMAHKLYGHDDLIVVDDFDAVEI